MRPEPASNITSRRQIALVLGDAGVGKLICERLKDLGFMTRLELPPTPNSTPDQLRAVLREFAQKESSEGTLWLHPGVTPVAERTEWPTICREFGCTFIGPPPRSLSVFNNRLSLLGEAEKISISNLLLVPDPLHSVREIEKLIRTNKFKLPCVLKSVRGGSGQGVRVIHQLDDLGKSLGLWLEQNRRNLGEVIILAERYVEGARRIVQPFVRFADGHVELFPLVDASLTSRLRKVVEFCPAQGDATDAGEFKQVREWTRALAQRTGYVGVGSLEYLVDGSRCYLIEGIPRLNTSFDLWESVLGTSAVAWQLAAMAGPAQREMPGCLSRREWKTGLALRVYAEDPVLQLPQPGTVREVSEKREWVFPGSVARLDLAVEAGTFVDPMGSSVLGCLLVGAEDRKRAMTVARGLLEEVWIAGSIQTNERFLHELLTHPWVQEGMFHASFVDEEFIPSVRPDEELTKVIARMAQLLSENVPGSAQAKWAVGDQWIKTVPVDAVSWRSGPNYFHVGEMKGLSGVFQSEKGPALRVCCYPLSGDRWQARVGNWFLPVRKVVPKSTQQGPIYQKLSALVAGRVHSILFRQGSWISAHEPALLVESLGMLVPHALPVDVRVVRWHVGAEDMVHAGQLLAEFERAAQVR